jgi:hypothetical protein
MWFGLIITLAMIGWLVLWGVWAYRKDREKESGGN